MKKLLLGVLLVASASCSSVQEEVTKAESNRKIVVETYPSSHVEMVRGFNYVFLVSNTENVLQVKLKNSAINTVDTLKTFPVAIKNTRPVVYSSSVKRPK